MHPKGTLEKITAEDISQTLESASKVSKRYDINVEALRPCIGRLMDTPLFHGSSPNRNEAALMIANEFHRCGKDETQTLQAVREWNSRNIDPLRESEMVKAVRNGFTGKYPYSCKNLNMQQFCIGESCSFAAHQKGKRGKYFTNLDFVSYGWPQVLSNSAKLVYYLAIPFLEKLMGVGPGGQVIANQRRIAKVARISTKSVRKGLRELTQKDLITYEPGAPRKWEGKASKIRRVIPIPKLPKELLLKEEK